MEQIDVDDLFDNELEAASQSAEFDDYAQADDGNAVDDRGIAEERRTARMHNEWEESEYNNSHTIPTPQWDMPMRFS